ncbi:MAG: substrate-binding domain-containing protein [Candidatus Brocadiia bacterium]
MERSVLRTYLVPLLGMLAVVVVVAALLCADGGGTTPHLRTPVGLLILCDEDVSRPLERPDVEHEAGVIGRFRRRAGVRVEGEYATSQELLEALLHRREGDLLLTADERVVEEARRQGLVYETRFVARLVPVIIARREIASDVGGVADLANDALRLAVVPEGAGLMGRVTAEVLRKGELAAHELKNIHFEGNSAYEVARAVETDRADVSIVWRPTAELFPRNTRRVEIAPDMNVTVPVEAVVLNTSESRREAVKFADFLTGPASQEVFERHAFERYE